jgi:hypothetical protein
VRGIEVDHDDNEMPVPAGKAPKNPLSASRPPAEAPMPTITGLGESVAASVTLTGSTLAGGGGVPVNDGGVPVEGGFALPFLVGAMMSCFSKPAARSRSRRTACMLPDLDRWGQD